MYPKSTKTALKGSALLCAAALLTTGMYAQSSTPPPADTTTTTTTTTTTSDVSNDKVTTLEKYTVSDVPLENQILPTVRPIDSVYGDDRSIIDIPRSVSSVNKAWMDDRQVKNAWTSAVLARRLRRGRLRHPRRPADPR